jgi:uncharacterized hydrophobic protein (TIGR00271 family)
MGNGRNWISKWFARIGSKIQFLRMYLRLKELLNLKEDFDQEGCSEVIRGNVEFRSGNAWSLIFAIFVASIGLQVNSTAVIIGAMLISPLMGPIVGAGFALGVYDFELLKKSLVNLSYAVGISLVTSALFFLLSPGDQAQSELLARTEPSFYDVMIAFFGGAAGIVASSRKIKGNAIPGVAIATALMPPLCTAGYGLANFDFRFVVGALYLFLINATFIFASTYLFVSFLGFSECQDRDPVRNKQIHRWMTYGAIVIIFPSLVMAWYLQKRTTFESKAQAFVEASFNFDRTIVGQRYFTFGLFDSQIRIKTVGEPLGAERLRMLEQSLSSKFGLTSTKLEIVHLSANDERLTEFEQKFATKADILKQRELDAEQQKLEFQKTIELVNLKLKTLGTRNSVIAETRTGVAREGLVLNWQKVPTPAQRKQAEDLVLEIATRTLVLPIFHNPE